MLTRPVSIDLLIGNVIGDAITARVFNVLEAVCGACTMAAAVGFFAARVKKAGVGLTKRA